MGNESCTHESGAWTRHPVLYMVDGTVVLLAGDTVFRVYLGLLSVSSEIFRGMASLPESHQESYDGCPLIRLQDDAQDLALFLGATMGLHYFDANAPTSFKCAAGILRLATKYLMAPLRRQALQHFGRVIPVTFEELQTIEGKWEVVFGPEPSDTPHPFQLVALFRECQVTHFLPATLFLASQEVPYVAIIRGDCYNEVPVQLSVEDKNVVLLGREKLRNDGLKIVYAMLMSIAPDCTCSDSFHKMWFTRYGINERRDQLSQRLYFSVLKTWPEELRRTCEGPSTGIKRLYLKSAKDLPCSACRNLWYNLELAGREKTWNDLPQTFGLHSWPVLHHEGNTGYQDDET